MSFFRKIFFRKSSLTEEAKKTEADIKAMLEANTRLTKANSTGDAEAIKIANDELTAAIKQAEYSEAVEVFSHTNPEYEPHCDAIRNITHDLQVARDTGRLSPYYVDNDNLKSAYDKNQLSSGLYDIITEALATQSKQSKQSSGGRRYKSKKYKRTSKKHKRTSNKHKRTSKRHK